MPYAQIAGSGLLPGTQPIEIYYRDVDAGGAGGRLPLLVLHGGWGYGYYPFDAQFAALPDHRIVAPDRTGYGKSPRIAELPPRFHAAAAAEHAALLDQLAIDRCAIWGHSDGAVIAAIMAIAQPDRFAAVILEAMHLDRRKPRSREFFQMMADNPDGFGPKVSARLAAEHGDDYWRTVLRAGGQAWLHIAATPDEDLYDHRLPDLAVPALVLHGADDPRSEPDELERIAALLPRAGFHVIAGAGHSPHSERAARDEAATVGARFLAEHA